MAETIERATEWMLAKMRDDHFTFSGLHIGADVELGPNQDHYRLADRLIQRERRAGHIHQIKRGVWEVIGG